jgi:flagellar biosynthesis/type III secretory pathway M-ring protein FliF/YscJ
MLPKRTLTKKEKKKIQRKKLGLSLIFIGLSLIAFMLFYLVFLEKDPPLINPLSKDQSSTDSKLIKILKEEKIAYKEIETTKDLKYRIKFDKNGEAILTPEKNLEEQIASLQLIISQLKIEGRTFKRLDFSYEKPIITF